MTTPVISSLDENLLAAELNPQQLKAVMAPVDTSVQVMAGAGTGKTKLMAWRFVRLAFEHNHLVSDPTRRLWVSTFTEKAAQEIRERIATTLLDQAVIPLHPDAWIGTFHHLCYRLLQGHENRLPHLEGFTLLSDVELDQLKESLVQALLNNTADPLTQALEVSGLTVSPLCLSPEPLFHLDIEDYEAFFNEVVYNTIPRLKAAGLSPASFYTQAIQQAQQFHALVAATPVTDPGSGLLWEAHESYANGWQKHYAPLSHSRFTFYPSIWETEIAAAKAMAKGEDPPTEIALLRDCLKPWYKTGYFVAYNGRSKKAPFSPAVPDKAILDRLLLLETRFIEIVSAVYALYQYQLRLEKVCDYDDLILEAIHLLSQFPDIQAKYQDHFLHFMVDEFQDSNGAQLKLLQLLNGEGRNRVTAVGDMKQSIYGFRFAEPENLNLLFETLPACQKVTLQTNYRSAASILALANRVTDMMELPEDQTLLSARVNTEEQRVVWLQLSSKTSSAEAKATEVNWIAQTVADLILTEGYLPKDIAVLVRDHGKALRIEEALDALGIPAVKQKNLGFFQAPVIQQMLSLLELAANPHDDFALINLLQQKLNHRQLYKLSVARQTLRDQGDFHHVSYFQTLSHFQSQPEAFPADLLPTLPLFNYLVAAITQFQHQAQSLKPDVLLDEILEAFPLLSPQMLETLPGKKAQHQLNLLVQAVGHWVRHARSPMSLADVLDLIHRCQAKENLELPVEEAAFFEDAVRILTVHGAKGLEFPVVFLAGVDHYRRSRYEGTLTVDPQHPGKLGVGLFLNRWQDEKTLKKLIYDTVWKIPRSEEEALRLFYVGLTRAKQRLFLSAWPRSFPYMNPSFFRDLPVEVLSETDIAWKSSEEKQHCIMDMKTRIAVSLASVEERVSEVTH